MHGLVICGNEIMSIACHASDTQRRTLGWIYLLEHVAVRHSGGAQVSVLRHTVMGPVPRRAHAERMYTRVFREKEETGICVGLSVPGLEVNRKMHTETFFNAARARLRGINPARVKVLIRDFRNTWRRAQAGRR